MTICQSLCTTDATVETKLEALVAGASDFLTKPLDPLEAVLRMPEMDGLTLAQAIKAVAAISATRLIVLTSLGQALRAEEWKRAGIEWLAHRLVGASANCGMICVVAPLRELERIGRSRRLNGAERLSAAVSDQLNRPKQFLADYLQSM